MNMAGAGKPGTPPSRLARAAASHSRRLKSIAGQLGMLLAAGLTASAGVCAQDAAQARPSSKDDQEPVLRLPARASGNALHPVTVSAVARQTFLVDLDSISIEQGNLVRYLLVAVSPSGVRNVSYEGIRCHPLQKRVYAYGREDGSWATAVGSDWSPIGRGPSDRRQAMLAADYFCRTDGSPRPLDAIRWAIRTDASSAPRGS